MMRSSPTPGTSVRDTLAVGPRLWIEVEHGERIMTPILSAVGLKVTT